MLDVAGLKRRRALGQPAALSRARILGMLPVSATEPTDDHPLRRSRIAPEYCFDTARGDLFVCRIAGNFADENIVASLEYAVQVLSTSLIMVLGIRSRIMWSGRRNYQVNRG